ncbi:MAG TPA: ATP-binding protein [Candidatus Sulfotelmatobacter sp.]|nr:ATP-binding protein [Candidatus Sulfotelmatobacter sp.]
MRVRAKPIIVVALRRETDIVLARQRTRQLAELLGFDTNVQTRITTAVSEIARNVLEHGRGGRIGFRIVEGDDVQALEIVLEDRGPGIADLEAVLQGTYQSPTGMGIGLRGARRLMDAFEIDSAPERGTVVTMRKLLPGGARRLDAAALADLADRLAEQQTGDPLDEIRRQNQDLLLSLDQVRERQEELIRLNAELEDTNRGVVALYAELDETAGHLRRADDLKTRFLSNMTHEFRTPLNSILALSRMLQERLDGPLTEEQERQVGYIRAAAESLSELVNDLLDLAKVEAGKTEIAPAPFAVETLFGTLRGMLRPLLAGDSVALVFDDVSDLPLLDTDESKLGQILRNLISNALKFTERGEVRVSAQPSADGRYIAFTVRDSGIGIAPEDQERIFDEYTQIDNRLQGRVKGTGLGLPLSKRLAELLGGTIAVSSAPGAGSCFTVSVPRVFGGARAAASFEIAPGKLPVLAVEDTEMDVELYRRFLAGTRYQLFAVSTTGAARQALATLRPRAILLDALLVGEACWPFLVELKRGWSTRDIPIVLLATMEEGRRALGMGADDYCQKPIARDWLLAALDRLVGADGHRRILVIDDDVMSRYLVRRHLADLPVIVTEAASGEDGVQSARQERPDAICLDLRMPGLDGYQVIERLGAEPTTRGVPIVVITSTPVREQEQARLAGVVAVLTKDKLSKDQLIGALSQAGMPLHPVASAAVGSGAARSLNQSR